jgi:hypothetical protein
MKRQFHGTINELKTITYQCYRGGQWTRHPNGVNTFRALDGSGVHWSETKKTIWFDGPQRPRVVSSSN